MEINIDEETILQAVGHCLSYDGKTVRILLEYGGKVRQRVVLKAPESARLPVLEALLDRGGKLNEQVLRKAAGNDIDGPNIVYALIMRIGLTSMLVDAFSKMMVMAADAFRLGLHVMEMLFHLPCGKSVNVVEEVLLELNPI
ncbi:MAG: hypothetical protein Q9207_003637, partial [Kuettlingeria erythrocarpa]